MAMGTSSAGLDHTAGSSSASGYWGVSESFLNGLDDALTLCRMQNISLAEDMAMVFAGFSEPPHVRMQEIRRQITAEKNKSEGGESLKDKAASSVQAVFSKTVVEEEKSPALTEAEIQAQAIKQKMVDELNKQFQTLLGAYIALVNIDPWTKALQLSMDAAYEEMQKFAAVHPEFDPKIPYKSPYKRLDDEVLENEFRRLMKIYAQADDAADRSQQAVNAAYKALEDFANLHPECEPRLPYWL